MLPRVLLRTTLLGLALLLPPLLAVWASGEPVAPLLRFPPLTRPCSQPGFSWPAFLLIAGLVAASLAPYLQVARRLARPRPRAPAPGGSFPAWGWLGVGLLLAAWYVAWSRHPWLAPIQRHTFTPLWLGYIVSINARTHRRTGRSLLSHQPGMLLALFPLSAAFWWFFEWLNRFVRNWHYVGVDDFSAIEYVLFASVSFSTVLPAVLSTLEWLESFPRLAPACTGLRPVGRFSSPALGWALLVLAAAGGWGIATWPTVLFPLVWTAPLLAVVGAQKALGEATAFAPAAQGDWRPLLLPPLAALVCGFFWELWNWGSLAHWEYAVPYVDRFHLFEMPALGYAGYLPFGLECLAAASLLPRARRGRARER